MAPVSMIAALGALLLVALLTAAAVAWCLTLYQLAMFAWRYRRARGAGWAPATQGGLTVWFAPNLPPDVARHRDRLVRALRILFGCLLAGLLLHGLGELLAWILGSRVPA